MLVPLFFAIVFAACIIGTYHQPHPNGIKLGVVGPPAQTAPLRAGIEKAAGSAFDISQVATVAEAAHDGPPARPRRGLRPDREPEAARDRDRRQRRRPHRRDGSRNARSRSVTTAQGAQLAVREVRPLAPGDEIGLGVFMFLIVCTICGYIAATVL